jgi:hypothetical protein
MAIFQAYIEVVEGDPELWKIITGRFATMNEMISDDPMIRRYYVTGTGIPEGTKEINVTVRRKQSSDWKTEYEVLLNE